MCKISLHIQNVLNTLESGYCATEEIILRPPSTGVSCNYYGGTTCKAPLPHPYACRPNVLMAKERVGLEPADDFRQANINKHR